MKRFLIVLCMMVISAVFVMPAFAINENVVVWENMYKIAQSDAERLEVVKKITEFKDREFAPVLLSALEDLVSSKIEGGTANEQYARNQLALLIVRELGELKSLEADESVYRLYKEVNEPVLKGAAAVALGKMRADSYAPYLAVDLVSINLAPIASIARNQEIIALGLVQSLEAMRDPVGYEAVFLASLGWYSAASRVKETAKAAALTMVDDPVDSLLVVLEQNQDTDVKLAALDTALASKAPATKKIAMAAAALRIGIERIAPDLAGKVALSKLRVNALIALARLQDHSPENVGLYIEVIKNDKKDDASLTETLNAYVALGVNGSDSAATFLSEKLLRYNEMQKVDGNTVRDKSLVRQIISSMELSKNPIVKTALTQALYVGHDNGIIRMAEESLAKLQ